MTSRLCRLVREMRKKKGWTLENLSAASGVSRSMLSQIERQRANPTLAVAYRISQALGLSLGGLVEPDEHTPSIQVIRASDSAYHYRSDKHCRIRTLSPLNLEKDVEFYELVLHPNSALRSAAHFQGTREFLTIQRGSARVTSGEDQSDLHPGDSANYPADIPHAIENTGKGDAVGFLVVIYARG